MYYVCLSQWFVSFAFERRERIDFSFTLQTSFPLCGEMGSSVFSFQMAEFCNDRYVLSDHFGVTVKNCFRLICL